MDLFRFQLLITRAVISLLTVTGIRIQNSLHSSLGSLLPHPHTHPHTFSAGLTGNVTLYSKLPSFSARRYTRSHTYTLNNIALILSFTECINHCTFGLYHPLWKR